LLLDTLEQELSTVPKDTIQTCLEIGSGSGLVTAFLTKVLNPTNTLFLCTDVNRDAAMTTRQTAQQNKVVVDVVQTDLIRGIRHKMDLVVFNPPYVATPDEEVGHGDIRAAWAGGVDGRVVIDEFLTLLPVSTHISLS
jgi:release factor glutamine methyltransferase